MSDVNVKPFLFVTDLDNTLVGDDDALAELNRHLSKHREECGTKIVYATGRSPVLYQELATERELIEPDVLVLSVGTEIYHNGSDKPDPDWIKRLSQNWDRDRVVATTAHFSDLVPQPQSEQGPFKASYFLSPEAAVEVLPQLEDLLQERGLDVKLVYSSGKDLDILPRCGNKGAATAFLRENFGISPLQTVVCGDSGNDLSMFESGETRGIIVGNAQPELLKWHQANPSDNRYFAKAYCAGGILEGLKNFGFLG
ncbi:MULTISPECIES: sucrose-phosphate phosphatase [Cyanophyceae]|uniref:sucrose-phosphate phosphatase n=1 Tax=Cyanophyceae TaxID=3028117 RepID=UPI0018EFDD8B|nr:sucrose-phosphate phosphatase [Trichocoleus sp. FACHB-40]